MTEQMSKFSDWLFQELTKREMSQSQLAKATGLTRQAISYYLSEKSKRPDDDALKEIARVFKIPVEEIYRAANILPPTTNDDELDKRIMHLIRLLPTSEKEKFAKRLELETQFYERPKPTRSTDKTRS